MAANRGFLARIGVFDDAVDRQFERIRGVPAVDRVMYTASELGDFGLIWLLVGTAQALRPGRDPRSALRLAAVLGAESALVNGPVKMLFRRSRPVPDAPRPHKLRQPLSSSFPSGHASAGFTFAGVASEDDNLASLYYAIAVVVAASRVHVRIHHASDVIAGAAVGIALGRIARRVFPK